MDDIKNTIRNSLLKRLIRDIPKTKHKKVITIDSNAELTEAFETLIKHEIRSAPVYDEKSGEYIGFLDIRDLMQFVVFACDTLKRFKTLRELIESGASVYMSAKELIDVKYLCRMHPFKAISQDKNVLEAAEEISKGIQRIAATDDNMNIVNIISQSTIASIVAEILELNPDINTFHEEHNHLESHEIQNIRKSNGKHLITSPVFVVRNNGSVLTMFNTMQRRNLSGLAVVNDEGQIISQTCASDLRLWLLNPNTVDYSVSQFLSELHNSSNNLKSFKLVTCTPKCSFQRIMFGLSESNFNKLFVVNEDNKPIGVVSISDVLDFLCH